jgi:hypothetical protein
VKTETLSELPRDKIVQVNVDDVIRYLNNNPDQKTIDQLYDFGKLLLDQIRGLKNSYDSKLTSCLGWGTATLAILLAGASNWMGTTGTHLGLARVGMLLAFLSVVASILGLKSWAGWKWPSEKDWFQAEFFSHPEKLKQQHLVAMLEAHQSYSRRTQRKGYALVAAEYLLAASALVLGAAVFLRQIA